MVFFLPCAPRRKSYGTNSPKELGKGGEDRSSEQKDTLQKECEWKSETTKNPENGEEQGDKMLKREDHDASKNIEARSQAKGNVESKEDQDREKRQVSELAGTEIQQEDTSRGYIGISDKRDVNRNGLKARIEKYPKSFKSDGNVIDFETIFADEVKKRNVVLEDILVSGREVSFLIAVSCHETNPKVTVRYTTDFWESVLNEEAKPFHAGNDDDDDDKLFQRFFLTLSVPTAECLEFALRCMGDLGTFWDNNNYSNFKVESLMENGSSGDLTAKFTPLKECMFDDMVKRRPVMLKNASLKDGKVVLTIATKESSTDLPGIRYTLDNWKSFRDVTSVESKGQDAGRNVSEIRLDIPKETKMIFAVFWRHGGIEYWDNNNRRDFEIQA